MMGKFIATNLRYPAEARRTGTEGRVIVGFTIGADGVLSNFRIVQGVSKALDEEAIRVVALMPTWHPELKDGVPVPCAFGLPISFRLEGSRRVVR
jgi:TonB family protein